MSKNCEREAGGLTAKKQWWLRAYSPRSVTHAWVCPRFPEKDEEVGSCGILFKVLLNSCGQFSTNKQDLDIEELCQDHCLSLPIQVCWNATYTATDCSNFPVWPMNRVVFIATSLTQLGNFWTSMMVSRNKIYCGRATPDPADTQTGDDVPKSRLHFPGNHRQEKFPLSTISPKLSWHDSIMAGVDRSFCHLKKAALSLSK